MSSTSDSTIHELYGGAITVSLPANIIDATDLREIPDHQEVFVFPDSLSSIIFEINEYQSDVDVQASTSSLEPRNVSRQDRNGDHQDDGRSLADIKVAEHHFLDTLAESDSISPSGIESTPISLTHASLSHDPSYISTTTILIPELDRSRVSSLPVSWQSNPAVRYTETKATQILIRMKQYSTDFVVRLYVPMMEYERDEEAGRRELDRMQTVMDRVLESLEVKDFSLLETEHAEV